MTRINSGIDPEELCDQHLVAEYREIGRIGVLLQERIEKGVDVLKNKPKEFTLGTGHMLFYIDKGIYLKNRFFQLKKEMLKRGFSANLEWRNHFDNFPEFNNDWSPTITVREILLKRITERMPKNPQFSKMAL